MSTRGHHSKPGVILTRPNNRGPVSDPGADIAWLCWSMPASVEPSRLAGTMGSVPARLDHGGTARGVEISRVWCRPILSTDPGGCRPRLPSSSGIPARSPTGAPLGHDSGCNACTGSRWRWIPSSTCSGIWGYAAWADAQAGAAPEAKAARSSTAVKTRTRRGRRQPRGGTGRDMPGRRGRPCSGLESWLDRGLPGRCLQLTHPRLARLIHYGPTRAQRRRARRVTPRRG